MELRPYQEDLVSQAAMMLTKHRKIVVQLPTGAGKTRTFTQIARRYFKKARKPVLILVHRIELLKQTLKVLEGSQQIVAGMKKIPYSNYYVGMIESTYKRLEGLDVGLVIIDEAHDLSFAKIHDCFPTQFIIGFTATPKTASKRNPLNKFYENIVCGIGIDELIKEGFLCQNITYAPKCEVELNKLKVENKSGDYNNAELATAFSKPKNIQRTLQAYTEKAIYKKTLIFNCNVEHSLAVNRIFTEAGFNSKHLDATSKDRYEILKWFHETPDAILNSIGILTTGFDEPTVECIIVNKATLSLPLWLQMCGRGSRPTETKKYFTIIDMGANSIAHKDWNHHHDWKQMFFPVPKVREGVAPVKECPNCGGIIHASLKICKLEYERFCCIQTFKRTEQEETEIKLIQITQGIDIDKVIERSDSKGYNDWHSLFNIAHYYKGMPKEQAIEHYMVKAEQWHRIKRKDKRFNKSWYREVLMEKLS